MYFFYVILYNKNILNERMIEVSAKSFIGALATGVVLGAVAGMMIDPINDKQHKKICKTANNMFKTIGTIVDDVINM